MVTIEHLYEKISYDKYMLCGWHYREIKYIIYYKKKEKKAKYKKYKGYCHWDFDNKNWDEDHFNEEIHIFPKFHEGLKDGKIYEKFIREGFSEFGEAVRFIKK